ncbi:hypothetical protein AAGG74_17210 [Bacillus mexicanus]|uniref:hypothetical protein n=1 Tax=Bacillus mexicanus TaxID=2834415 RepID=UPI003D1DE604
MQLRKNNIDPNQTINYFVHNKIKSGQKCENNEEWANEWLQQYVKNNSRKEEKLYKAFHSIPKYIEVWEQRINKKSAEVKSIKEKVIPIDFSYRMRAKELLEKNRYMTKVPFEELHPEEYKMIVEWFEYKKDLPEYLKGILKYRLTLEEKIEKLLGESIKELILRSQNFIFYFFLVFFFAILMLINL